MKDVKVFEGIDVVIITNDNQEPLFEIYSTGMALGYVRANNVGKMYPRKDRIDTVIKNAEIETCVHSGHSYITEEQLYDFMLEARTEKCKSFRRWVTSEVLPSIRKNGGYIMNQEELSDDELLARALLVAQRTIEKRNQTIKQQEERLKLQQPKVEVYDDFISNDDTFGFRELVKYINEKIGKKITENQVREYLRKEKLYVKQGNKYVVSQECVRRGFGVLKDNLVNGINRPQSRFTFKLRDNLIEVFK